MVDFPLTGDGELKGIGASGTGTRKVADRWSDFKSSWLQPWR
jgi:hypothetical protein